MHQISTEMAEPFKDRREAQEFFANVDAPDIDQAMGLAYVEAAVVAPEIFYSQAARSISQDRLGDHGMPSQEAALLAYFDLAYMWEACRTESRYKWRGGEEFDHLAGRPLDAEGHSHLKGTRLELLFAAALAGARGNGAKIIARTSSAAADYYGDEAAYDLEIHTPDDDYSIQLKHGAIDEGCLRYDVNKVVIIALPIFAQYLPPHGKNLADRLTPYQVALANSAPLLEMLTDPQTTEYAQQQAAEALLLMEQFGEAVNQYLHDRPDKALVEEIRMAV